LAITTIFMVDPSFFEDWKPWITGDIQTGSNALRKSHHQIVARFRRCRRLVSHADRFAGWTRMGHPRRSGPGLPGAISGALRWRKHRIAGACFGAESDLLRGQRAD